tara:strand:+ start:42747 stop:43019 length:273 start_codon:yes stop_codon:yes gene_type:complete
MALISSTLATQLETAFLAAQADTTPTATTTLANSLATAIHTYLIQAQVTTTDTGTAVGGVNASAIVVAVPTPGPITVPAVVTGSGTGFLT